VSRKQTDVDTALDVFLEALGIRQGGPDLSGNIEIGFVDLHADREVCTQLRPGQLGHTGW
jgi:hypothetical protein